MALKAGVSPANASEVFSVSLWLEHRAAVRRRRVRLHESVE